MRIYDTKNDTVFCNKYWQTVIVARATIIISSGTNTSQSLISRKTGHVSGHQN